MTSTFIALSLPGAFAVGVIMAHVVTYIHRAAAPRVHRLHSADMAWLKAVDVKLTWLRIHAQLRQLQGFEP
jgi:hypothetical protein